MKRLMTFCIALLCLSCTGPTDRPVDVVTLVPGDNEISGWTRSSPMQVAETGTQLEAMIDGEAVPYEDNHFVKCAFQNFSGGIGGSAVELALRIFDMGDTTNAKNVYAAVAAGTEVPWSGDNPGVEARTDESFLFAYRVEFRDGRFYFRADIMDKSTAAQDIAKLFARNVSSAIRDTTNAKNVYAAVAAGTEVPWSGDNPGVEARTDESFLFAYRVEFRDGRIYFRADIMDKSTAAQDIAKLFARNVSSAIRDTI